MHSPRVRHGIWQRPVQTLIPRVGVFMVVAAGCTLFVESMLALSLLASGTVDLRSHFVDAKAYAMEMLVETEVVNLGAE
jgi:hypothetical protein